MQVKQTEKKISSFFSVTLNQLTQKVLSCEITVTIQEDLEEVKIHRGRDLEILASYVADLDIRCTHFVLAWVFYG